MATRIPAFQAVVPAGTLKNAPATFAMGFDPGIVEEVEFRVPRGNLGLMGFQLAIGGQQVIPVNAGAFVITDGEVIRWPLEDQPTSGAWQLLAYNTDVFDHSVYVRFLVAEIPVGGPPAPRFLDLQPS